MVGSGSGVARGVAVGVVPGVAVGAAVGDNDGVGRACAVEQPVTSAIARATTTSRGLIAAPSHARACEKDERHRVVAESRGSGAS